MLYRVLVRPLLYLLPAETAHHLGVWALRLAQAIPGMLWVLRRLWGAPTPVPVRALGIDFPSPIGLAAGFDKNAEVYDALGALGFGFVEVGTITGEAQPGNPRPRLFRLVQDRALLNRMGFNNRGCHDAARRLARRAQRGRGARPILGINIGKTKKADPSQAAEDYEKSARALAPFADYFVVNVSSPNTPGLRDLQAVEALEPILATVRAALDQTVRERRVPLLVKIAPDLADDDIRSVASLCLRLGLDGIIATNTTISREGLTAPADQVASFGPGGLSGAPLKQRSLRVLRLLREVVGDRVVLVAAGGIETPEDAWERLEAGASLVQVYSALVFQGPSLPGRLARGLRAKMLDDSNDRSVV